MDDESWVSVRLRLVPNRCACWPPRCDVMYVTREAIELSRRCLLGTGIIVPLRSYNLGLDAFLEISESCEAAFKAVGRIIAASS